MHILIVDDSRSKRVMLQEASEVFLSGQAVSFAHAGTLREAKQRFSKQQPDLIFLDGNFPEEFGKRDQELGPLWAEELSRDGYQGIMVAISGDFQTQEKLRSAGCQEVLSAPINLEDVHQVFVRRGFLSQGGP